MKTDSRPAAGYIFETRILSFNQIRHCYHSKQKLTLPQILSAYVLNLAAAAAAAAALAAYYYEPNARHPSIAGVNTSNK